MQKDKIYLKMAQCVAQLSKDSEMKVGAIIVGDDGTPVSWGYSGTLSKVDETLIPADKEDSIISLDLQMDGTSLQKEVKSNRSPFVYHAESNAISFASRIKLKNSTMYITNFPCIQCTKEIARAGIKRVVILPQEDESELYNKSEFNTSLAIFATSNIEVQLGDTKVNPKIKEVK